MRLIPREESFFDLFDAAAKNVHDAAGQLVEFLEKFENTVERAKRVHDVEHANDRITLETIERLNKTFITPIDREDVNELINRLDDCLDLIDEAVNRMVLYRVEKPTEEAINLAHCIRHASAILLEAMPLLRDMKHAPAILQKCADIHTQENEADRIEHRALAALFESPDPRYIIKWKDIYGDLEGATDKIEDVADVLRTIVLKNA